MISRRLFSIGLLSASAALGDWQVSAGERCKLYPTLPRDPLSPDRFPTWRSNTNSYFCYPHSNGFYPGSTRPIIAALDQVRNTISLTDWDFSTGKYDTLHNTSFTNMYWDVCDATRDLLYVDKRSSVKQLNLNNRSLREIYSYGATKKQKLESLLSVSKAGSQCLIAIENISARTSEVESASIIEVNTSTGASETLCNMPFNTDHQHYCPFDESIVGFSHEGDISGSFDRVWAINRKSKVSSPQIIWDEKADGYGKVLAGHERWAFHAAGAIVVAYSNSNACPSGLYFVNESTKTAQLISASNYDWHCNISRDGRWAIVDTAPPASRPREDDGRVISDIVLVNMGTGQRRWLARSHCGPSHPWHPHPHFSPDGKFVIFNDYQAQGAGSDSQVVIINISDLR